MDMITSTLAGMYSNAQTASTQALQSKLSTDYSSKSDEELMEACKDFEQYLYEQMFQAMRKLIPETDEDSNSNSMLKDYYEDQLYSQYAETLTEQNADAGVGIAQTMYEQMKSNYNLS